MTSNKLKLVSAVSAVLFSLVTCFTGAFAWFSAQNIEDDASKNFEVNTDPNILSFEIALYKYDIDTATGYVTYESDPDFSLVLNNYDKFVPERNVNNNNIVRFEMQFASTMPATSTRRVSFDFECNYSLQGQPFDPGIEEEVPKTRTHNDTAGYKYTCESTSYVCNNISNVLYFKILPYTYYLNGSSVKFNENVDIDETDADKTYQDATKEFSSLSKSYFVAGGNKSTKVQGNYVDVNPAATGMVIYIEYSYDQALIDSFLTPNEFVDNPGSSSFIATGSVIEFYKDVLGFFISSEAV